MGWLMLPVPPTMQIFITFPFSALSGAAASGRRSRSAWFHVISPFVYGLRGERSALRSGRKLDSTMQSTRVQHFERFTAREGLTLRDLL